MRKSDLTMIFLCRVLLNLLDMLHNANKSEGVLSYVEVNKVFCKVFYINFVLLAYIFDGV